MKTVTRTVVFVLLSAAAFARWGVQSFADDAAHPIDRALDACVEKNSSTAGMVRCNDRALKAWDTELNKNYRALSARLKAKDRAALKEAQQQWLRFRNREYRLIAAMYGRLDGTMYAPMRVAAAMQISRRRALELRGYLELLSPSSASAH